MRGRHDHKGQYEAIDQEHATVQMADINGSSALHTAASEHQSHQNIQVGDLNAQSAQSPLILQPCLVESREPRQETS